MAGTALASGLCIAAAIVVRLLATVSRTAPSAEPSAHPLLNTNRHARTEKLGLTKSAAEDRLDWLEAHGRNGNVFFVSGEDFRVR
jgi:hypothetical protein